MKSVRLKLLALCRGGLAAALLTAAPARAVLMSFTGIGIPGPDTLSNLWF